MLSNCARTGRTLPVKALLSVLSLTLLAAASCVGSAVSAQPAQPAVWRGNSRAAAYTFSPVRTSPTVAWQYQLPMKSLFAPLTLDGDTLYVISQDSVLRALNVNTRQEKWSKFLAAGIDSGTIISNGTLYFTADKGLYALDTSNGIQRWVFNIASSAPAAPAAADGVIYFAQDNGVAHAVDMATGQERWHSASGGDSVTVNPVVYDDGMVYVPGGGSLIALDASNGAEKWRATRPGGSWIGAVVVGGVVYAPHEDNFMYALDARTGAELWKTNMGGVPSTPPALADGILYGGTKSDKLYALDARTGSRLWTFDTDDWPSFPSVVSGILYVGTTNHEGRDGPRNLYALDAHSGSELWRFQADSRLFAPPAFADNIIYLQSWFGKVYALTAAPVSASPTPPPVPTVTIPGAGSQTFPETGKTVRGLFLEYWKTHGGLAQQGYPISEEFTEVSDLNGKLYTVQYFERAVFEQHPENAAPYDVLLSQLGTFQYKAKYGGK